MASNFKILVHRNSDSLHLKLVGDFDGTSAHELLNSLTKNARGVRRVFIQGTYGLPQGGVGFWARHIPQPHFRRQRRTEEHPIHGKGGRGAVPMKRRFVFIRNHELGGTLEKVSPRVPPFKTLQAGLTAFGGEAGGEIGLLINSQHSLHPLNWQRSSLVRLHHASAGRSPHKGVRGNVVPPAGL